MDRVIFTTDGSCRYHYGLQTWTRAGIVLPCGHKELVPDCAGCLYPGLSVADALVALSMSEQGDD